MPRILLIGKASFIGTNFIKYSKYKEIVEVDLVGKKPEDINLTGFDVIIHLAAIVHQSKQISFVDYLKVNTELPIKIAELSKESNVKQFIFLSSSKVYGKFEEGQDAWTEKSLCKPVDYYGISKLKAEEELIKLNDDRFNISVLRTPMVYGEGVKANMRQLIGLVDILPIIPLGKNSSKRSITYVENLVEYIDRIIELRPKGVFIAKDVESPSIEELVRFISKSIGKKRLLFNPGKPLIYLLKVFLPHYYERLYGASILDNTFTLKTLDFKPKYSTSEGIDKTVKHYLIIKHS